MHLPSANSRPSIYYNYQVFKPWLPTEHGPQEKKKVVIDQEQPEQKIQKPFLKWVGGKTQHIHQIMNSFPDIFNTSDSKESKVAKLQTINGVPLQQQLR